MIDVLPFTDLENSFGSWLRKTTITEPLLVM